MRTFLAIEIENHIKNKIDVTQEIILNSNSAHIKYVETENIHLTLKFFGDVNDNKIKKITKIINDTLKNYKVFTIKIVHIGAFPNIKHPRVIWTGVKDKDKTTVSLIKELDEKFSEIGFNKEKDYVPHITIGRVKKIDDKEILFNTLKKLKKTYHGKMEVKRICLKSSTLTPNGPIYKTIEEFDLGDE